MSEVDLLNDSVLNGFYFGNVGAEVHYEPKHLSYLDKNNLLDYYRFHNKPRAYEYKYNCLKWLVGQCSELCGRYGIKSFFMKSFLNYPFIDGDLDIVIVDEHDRFISLLTNQGFKWKRNLSDIREPLKRMYVFPETKISLHVHREVSWNGVVALDKFAVYKHCLEYDFNGIRVKIPSYNDEFLIAAAHFIFENYYFKIGDFIYLKYLIDKNLDWRIIWQQAEKYNYSKGLQLFIDYLHAFSQKYNLRIDQIQWRKRYIIKNGPFPYYIPYCLLIPVYLEKIVKDMASTRFKTLPRQLFTYSLVGGIWKYALPKFLRANRYEI